MSHSARSVFIFGVYLVVVGVGLMVVPNTVFSLLGFPASSEVWPRVVGVLALCLAGYYMQAARAGLTAFFRWTVYVRAAVFATFGALVLLHLAPAMLAVLGTVDLLAAIWTGFALRSATIR